MGQRTYRRDSQGRFKGGGGGKVTTGKAGGFANASHRARVSNAKAAKAHNKALVRKGVKVALAGASGATSAALIGSAAKQATGSNTAGLAAVGYVAYRTGKVIKSDIKRG